MRIVAGTARGRPLAGPPRGVRPTSDKVREALFGILGQTVVGTRTLDLYAGTGALGLEALSRGATSVVLVESDTRAAAVVRRNADTLGLTDRARILHMPVARALRVLGREGGLFDLVLVDPPYGEDLGTTTLRELSASGLLAENAAVVVETATRDPVPGAPGVTRASSRRYGDTTLHFFLAANPGRPAGEPTRSTMSTR